ncbi:MAG: hypothetical protein ABR975_08720 [Vulcanimicrobiaceae bacterium]|jgi:hypothetical protein
MSSVFSVYPLLAIVVIVLAQTLRRGAPPIRTITYVVMIAVAWLVAIVSLVAAFDRALLPGSTLSWSRALGLLIGAAMVVGVLDKYARHRVRR